MDTTQFLTNVHVNYVERKPKAVRTRWGLTQHYAPGQGFRMVPSRSLWEACTGVSLSKITPMTVED